MAGNVPVYRQQLVSFTAVVYKTSNSCKVVAGNVPVYRQQLVSSTAVVHKTSNSCNVKLWPIFIYLINYGDVLYIFWHTAYRMLVTVVMPVCPSTQKLFPLDRHNFCTASS